MQRNIRWKVKFSFLYMQCPSPEIISVNSLVCILPNFSNVCVCVDLFIKSTKLSALFCTYSFPQ